MGFTPMIPLEKQEKKKKMGYSKKCKMAVLVDNRAEEGFEEAWGLSIFIETDLHRVLFDTGPDPEILKRNMERLGIKPSDLDFVVISHAHSDHTGGASIFS